MGVVTQLCQKPNPTMGTINQPSRATAVECPSGKVAQTGRMGPLRRRMKSAPGSI